MVSPPTKQAAPARPWTANRRSEALGMATSSPTCWARVARASVRTPTRAAWRRPTSSGSRRSGRGGGGRPAPQGGAGLGEDPDQGGVEAPDLVRVEAFGAGEGRHPGPVEDVVAPGVADPGHGPLVGEHALEGVAALGQDRSEEHTSEI